MLHISAQCGFVLKHALFGTFSFLGHSWSRQGDACLGCLFRSGLHSEEHGDLSESSGGAAKPCHSGQTLAAANAGHSGAIALFVSCKYM